jgi:hypothetical protein
VTSIRRWARAAALAAGVLLWSSTARAEWQFKPFVGLTYSASTNLIVSGLGQATIPKNLVYGMSVSVLGEVFGVEVDAARAPGFFQPGNLIVRSNLSTLTGNVVVALPRRLAEYTLRPYFVGGAGLMRPTTTESFAPLSFSRNMAAVDWGGGATGFLGRSVGVNWDLRHFRNVSGRASSGNTIDDQPERLSFWRATMALAVRY